MTDTASTTGSASSYQPQGLRSRGRVAVATTLSCASAGNGPASHAINPAAQGPALLTLQRLQQARTCALHLFQSFISGKSNARPHEQVAQCQMRHYQFLTVSHDMIRREMAGGFLADFNLQGRMPDSETLPQLVRSPQEECVPGMTGGKHKMRGQRIFCRA